MAILFALVSYFGWGSGDIFVGLSSRKIGTIPTIFWLNIFGQLLPTLFIPFALGSFPSLKILSLLIIILIGLLNTAAGLSYVEGLRIGNASIVGTIGGSFTSIVVLLSLMFLGESLFPSQILAIIIIFAGIVLCSLNFADVKEKNLLNRGTLLALFSMVAWGIGFTIIKIPVRELGWFWTPYLEGFVGFSIFTIVALRQRKKYLFIPDRQDFSNLLLGGILPAVGFFSYNYAISIGQASIVAPVAGSSITLFVLLSRFAFKDRLSKQQWFGILITLVGIVLLAFLSK